MVRGYTVKAERAVRFRFGYDEDELNSLLFEDFYLKQDHIEAEKAEQIRNQMIAATFTAWQLGAGEKGQSFRQHLRRYGLDESEPQMTTQERERVKARALDTADKINAAYKAGRLA